MMHADREGGIGMPRSNPIAAPREDRYPTVGVLLVCCLAGLGACGGRTPFREPLPDGAGPDAAHPDAAHPDAAHPDAGVGPDAGPFCDCSSDGPVYQWHECVPPLQFGCPAEACDPDASGCGEGYTCLPCSAAACCECAACVAACSFTGPAMGPLPEPLKIWPTFGTAGQEQEISIEGFPFYVGALYYLARLGDSDDLWQQGGGTCSFDIRAPAMDPGMVPVWVSQYGGIEPWVLAGFFTYSGGVYPECVQPGFPCGDGWPCCETSDVPMACTSGRCLRL
jgi:hypothetical protein